MKGSLWERDCGTDTHANILEFERAILELESLISFLIISLKPNKTVSQFAGNSATKLDVVSVEF